MHLTHSILTWKCILCDIILGFTSTDLWIFYVYIFERPFKNWGMRHFLSCPHSAPASKMAYFQFPIQDSSPFRQSPNLFWPRPHLLQRLYVPQLSLLTFLPRTRSEKSYHKNQSRSCEEKKILWNTKNSFSQILKSIIFLKHW